MFFFQNELTHYISHITSMSGETYRTTHVITFSTNNEFISNTFDKKTYSITDTNDENIKMNITFGKSNISDVCYYVSSMYNDEITCRFIKILFDKFAFDKNISYIISRYVASYCGASE